METSPQGSTGGFAAFARRQRGIMAAAAVLVGFLLAAPLVSEAAPGPYAHAKITCSPKINHAGNPDTVTGAALPANSMVTITWDGTTALGSTMTTSNGGFSTVVTLPKDATQGTHTIDASVADSGGTVTTSCSVKIIYR